MDISKSSLQSAIELKSAIDKIPSVISSIGECAGYCDSDIEDEYQEKIGCIIDDDNDSKFSMTDSTEDQLALAIKDILNRAISESPEYFAGHLDIKFLISKIGIKKGNITRLTPLNAFTEEKIKRLYNMATPAPFGDLQKVETVYDESVRKAREMNSEQFSVEDLLLTEISKLWKFQFDEIPDKVVSYKINIYGPGDKFEVHRDAPAKNLVGTFLIGLGDTSTEGGLEIVKESEEDIEEEGNCEFMGKAIAGKWFAFRTNEYHRVKEIKGGYRAIMSFKIYINDAKNQVPAKCKNHDVCVNLSSYLSELFRRDSDYGFILSHEYCLEGSKLVGIDAILYDVLRHYSGKFKRIEIIPVIVDYDRTSWDGDWEDGGPEIQARVYPLTEEAINYALDRSKSKPLNYDDLCIVNTGGKPYSWQYSYSRGGYTGNEAEPSEVNAIYLHRAILLIRN